MNSESLLVFFLLLLGLFSTVVDRIQSVSALALAQLYALLVNVHLASVLAVVCSSTTATKAKLHDFGVEYL